MVPTYDPKLVILTLGDIQVSGYAKGTMIQASRDADSFTKYVGTDGEVSRVKNRNRAGSLTVTLTQIAACNDQFSALLARDELFGDGVAPMQLVDMGGTSLLSSDRAWIRKPAEAEFGEEMGSRVWVIDCANLEATIGSTPG